MAHPNLMEARAWGSPHSVRARKGKGLPRYGMQGHALGIDVHRARPFKASGLMVQGVRIHSCSVAGMHEG